MKILLLGSTGQVGTAIESSSRNKGIECVGLDREKIEITRPEELESAVAEHKPEVVVNSVALQAIDNCETCPKEAFDVNSIAVWNLAKICKKWDIALLQLSTHSVFDGTKDGYYTEKDRPNPINIYGASKYMGEVFARNFCEKHYIVRLPTMFGKRRAGYPGFIDKVLRWTDEGRELNMADDKIDSFAYTADAANSLINMLKEELPFGVYHITNSGKASYYDFVSKMTKMLDLNIRVNRARDKDFKSTGNKPLKTQMKSIKLKPLRSWEDALCAYITNEVKK